MEPRINEFAPDGYGIREIEIGVGSCELCGYWGPRRVVAETAREDGLLIEGGEGATAVLVNVRTDSSDQHRGLGTAAVRAFVDYVKMRGVAQVYLRAVIQDEGWSTIEWYTRLGFRVGPGAKPDEPQMHLDLARPEEV